MAEKKRTPAAGAQTESAPSFEEALERLESIVSALEDGSITLEESIARYEEGIGLAKQLTRTLDEAEKRIERLVEPQDGDTPVTEPAEVDLRNDPGAPEGRLPL